MNTPIKHKLPNGTVQWRLPGGKIHRDNGPAIIYSDGEEHWYKNGKHHRADGPAIIYPSGEEHWYNTGKLHREDGPAIVCPDGIDGYLLNGIEYDPITFIIKSYEYTNQSSQ